MTRSDYLLVEEETKGDYRLRVYYDEVPSSPRDDDNLATIIGWSRDYNLSDDNMPKPRGIREDYEPRDWFTSWANLDDDSRAQGLTSNVLWFAPLLLADYGANGVRLALGDDAESYKGVWQRSAGVVFVTREDWKSLMGEDHPQPTTFAQWCDLIDGEIQTYAEYLSGHVYCYVVQRRVECSCCNHVEWETVDSCGGFYGSDDNYNALTEGRGSLESFVNDDGKTTP